MRACSVASVGVLWCVCYGRWVRRMSIIWMLLWVDCALLDWLWRRMRYRVWGRMRSGMRCVVAVMGLLW